MPDESPLIAGQLTVGRPTSEVITTTVVAAPRCWCGRPIRRPGAEDCVEHDIAPALEQENP